MACGFVKTDTAGAVEYILKRLTASFKGHQRVLWLVPGGSNIPIVVSVMAHVSAADSAKLAIMLTDERFGPVGFPDSNLRQLYAAGFKPKQATVVPVLQPGVPLAETTELYAQAARTAFTAADYRFGLFGMGADGHVAGILPGSPALRLSKRWATSYEAPEFTRITMTPFALSHLSEAVIVAIGNPEKRPALRRLRKEMLPFTEQPAQLLKKLAKVTVVNDQIGG